MKPVKEMRRKREPREMMGQKRKWMQWLDGWEESQMPEVRMGIEDIMEMKFRSDVKLLLIAILKYFLERERDNIIHEVGERG